MHDDSRQTGALLSNGSVRRKNNRVTRQGGWVAAREVRLSAAPMPTKPADVEVDPYAANRQAPDRFSVGVPFWAGQAAETSSVCVFRGGLNSTPLPCGEKLRTLWAEHHRKAERVC